MDFRQLSYFLGVASELHFSKASEKLFIAQPALSRQVQQLENKLGVLLFERDKRNVKLTPAGEYLNNEAQKILSQLDNIKHRTQLIHNGEEGEIRIGHPGSAIYSVIPPLLSALKLFFPSIKANLSEMLDSSVMDALKNYEIDVGFIRELHPDKYLTSKIIFREPFALILPACHPINEDNFKSLAQVKNDNFILPPNNSSSVYHDLLLRLCEREGFLPNVVHESNYGATILKLVEHNLGISLMPISYKHSSAMKVKFIELKNISEQTNLSIMWRKDDTNPVLQNFLKIADSLSFSDSLPIK
ncbi:LysR substrate-binding domain-containing protein [Arcicella aquatica]|uniref:LysR substrate-binding domain-containing protein n=1 Tax=Arcicella aquatica TaxID=217141 RepID=A0ABU5QIK0_9BACT|nr:LysR substrate-binding domain-containing protein [Arcicella aquatica]MEA5256549.1 LysR substrate-binding domain-containing protein [Arcicella aquatica]